MTPPLLIALPDGLNVSGVTMWGVRLVNGLVARGGAAGLILHSEPEGQRRLEVEIDPRVRMFRVNGPRFGERAGDLSPYLPHYRAAVRAMGEGEDGPVVLSPNLHGDCYGVAAALGLASPERVRVLGWQHSDNEYDARVLMHYEAVVSRFVAVSDAIEGGLKAKLRERARDVVNLPYGVEVGEYTRRGRSGQPKLLYSGRLEHMQKRVTSLSFMLDELSRRGVGCSLTIAGDGPAAGELAEMMRGRAELIGAVGPERVAGLLDEHDVLVLPSRFEGLSVAVLEAMARGCVPVVARTRSGAGQAVENGVSGLIADVGPEADEEVVGVAMAEAVEKFAAADRAAMSHAAWEKAGRFSLERHVDRVAKMMREVVKEKGREWPRERGCAFTNGSGAGKDAAGNVGAPNTGSGSVPADGAERMSAVLKSLRGRAVAIHGTGEHTRQLREVIVNAPVKLVAFVDDDRARHGARLWDWPVVSPRDVGKLGATDVVISSWMHQEAVWARRNVYERLGVRVWRVYQ